MSVTPAFQGEVQFRRWSDSSTQGVQVTFALPDSEALEPLKHKAGKRFMAVLVEIGDDEQPVQPAERRGPLCIEACDLCKSKEFQRWVREEFHVACFKEDDAKDWLCGFVGITSRKALDMSAEAASIFRDYVRVPFMKWQRERRKVAQ